MSTHQRRNLKVWMRRLARGLALGAASYVSLAYFVVPAFWKHYEHQPGLRGRPLTTVTAQGIPGDPLNIGLVGSKADVVKAWKSAGWHPADPVTLATSIEIVGSVVLHSPFPNAPVSDLYYDGRPQDLAFEKPVGGSADQRHHVRLWTTIDNGAEGRPVWLGSATFDRGVGVSHYTGQITHHIAANIDAERNSAIADLANAGVLIETYRVAGVGPAVTGRNGGGDRYFTDGEIVVGVTAVEAVPSQRLPGKRPSPIYIELTRPVWSWISVALGRLAAD